MTEGHAHRGLAEVDAALAAWRERLRAIDENLLALEAEPTYRLLDPPPGQAAPALAGATGQRVPPALAAMRELFAHRSRLADLLDRAADLRAGMSRWLPAGHTVAEIEQLLDGPSIHLPAAEVPLARRGLLSAAQHDQLLTPAELVSAMEAAFTQTRDVVLAVDRAWTRLYAELSAAAAELDSLEAEATRLGLADAPELRSAAAELRAVRSRADADPLGAETDLTHVLSARLAAARTRLAALAHERHGVAQQHAQAQTLATAIRATYQRAAASMTICRAQLVDAPGLPTLPQGAALDDLMDWLETLEARLADGHWHAAAVGLARWLAAAEEAHAAIRTADATYRALLEQRDELHGRLDARRAQLRSLRARGTALPSELEAQAGAIDALLRQIPVPLAEAADRLARFEAALQAALQR